MESLKQVKIKLKLITDVAANIAVQGTFNSFSYKIT